MTALLLISYLLGCVLIGGIADGLNDRSLKLKKPGHLLEAGELAIALTGAVIFQITWETYAAYLTVYIGLRIAFFDPAYNIAKGLPALAPGKSDYWSIFLSKYPNIGVVFARVLFLSLAIGVAIRYF